MKRADKKDRNRIILSDGKYFIQAMLATQLNHLVEGQKIDKFVTVKLTDFSTNSIQGKRYATHASVMGMKLLAESADS